MDTQGDGTFLPKCAVAEGSQHGTRHSPRGSPKPLSSLRRNGRSSPAQSASCSQALSNYYQLMMAFDVHRLLRGPRFILFGEYLVPPDIILYTVDGK